MAANEESICKDLQPVINSIRLKFVEKANCKLLVIMRGLPGSGKSTLARALQCELGGIIHSADFSFTRNSNSGGSQYVFDPTLLSEAHARCKQGAFKSMESGVHLVIIDNTNLEKCHMEPYVVKALGYQYDIELLEPVTPWRYKVKQLASSNSHGVTLEKLKEMHGKFSRNFDVPDWMESIRRKHFPKPIPNCQTIQINAQPKSGEGRKKKNLTLKEERQREEIQAFREVARQLDPSTIWSDLKQDDASSGGRTTKSSPLVCAGSVDEEPSMISVYVGESAFCPSLGREIAVTKEYECCRGPNPRYQPGLLHKECQTQSYLYPRWDEEMCLRRMFEIFPDVPRENLEYMLETCGSFELALEAIAETDPVFLFSSVSKSDYEISNDRESFLETVSCSSVGPNDSELNLSRSAECDTTGQLKSLMDLFPGISSDKLQHFLELTCGDVDWASSLILDSNPHDLMEEASSTPGLPNGSGLSAFNSPRSGARGPTSTPQPHVASGFLKYLHEDFKFRYNLGNIDLNSIPPELINDWVPSKSLAESMYREIMQHLGVLQSGKLSTSVPQIDSQWGVPKKANLPLREIISEEEAKERSLQEKRKKDQERRASRLVVQRLQCQFPDIEADYLRDIYLQHGSIESKTLQYLEELGHVPKQESVTKSIKEANELKSLSGDALSNEIQSLHRQHDQLIQKMRDLSSRNRQTGVASYYSQEASNLWKRLNQLEDQQAENYLQDQRKMQGPRRLDLHHLSVRCALRALKERVQELTPASGSCVVLHVVTGIGRHSKGKAKVKPAVANWLANKGLHFSETTDGGQLSVDLVAN